MTRIGKIWFLLIVLFLPATIIQAQDEVARTLDAAIETVYQLYGRNQQLVKGEYAGGFYKNDIGHPFFVSEKFKKGSITIHGTTYKDQLIRYNSFSQNVEVLHERYDGDKLIFIPPTDFVSAFSIYNKQFRKFTFPERKPHYYQVVYDGSIKCVHRWVRKRTESHHNVSFSAFKYYDDSKSSYLIIQNKLIRYRGKYAFIHAFPKENRKQIAQHIKAEKIKIKTATPQQLANLVEHCEKLIRPNHN